MNLAFQDRWVGRGVLNTGVLVACLGALWSVFVVATFRSGVAVDHTMIDSASYFSSAHALLGGGTPYSSVAESTGLPPPAVYPVAFVMAMVPLSQLPLGAAQTIWYVFILVSSVLACVATIELVQGTHLAWPTRRQALIVMGLVASFFFPLWANTKLGQVDALQLALVAGSMVLRGRKRTVLGGVLLGVAAAIKLPPIVLIAFGLWIGWRRFGLIALGTFAFLHLAPSALYPEWVAEYWQRALPGFVNDLSPVYNIAPLSLIRYLPAEIGGVARAIALAAAVLVFAAPFVLAIRAPGSQRIHLVALVMAAAVVGAPVVESYHLVSVLLPLWVLVSTLRLGGSRIQLITLGATLLLLSQPFHIAQLLSYVTRVPPEVLGGMVLELGAIALFVVLLYDVTRARNGHLRAHAR